MANGVLKTVHPKVLCVLIAEASARSGGSFTHHEVGDDGVARTWRVSLATGHGWLWAAADYARRFGRAPTWITRYDPYTRIRMLRFAMEEGRPLPQQPPLC